MAISITHIASLQDPVRPTVIADRPPYVRASVVQTSSVHTGQSVWVALRSIVVHFFLVVTQRKVHHTAAVVPRLRP